MKTRVHLQVIEIKENTLETFFHESPLLNNSKNELIVEQQKDAQSERKYFEHKPSRSKFFSAYSEVKLNNKLITKNVKRYLLKNAKNCQLRVSSQLLYACICACVCVCICAYCIV